MSFPTEEGKGISAETCQIKIFQTTGGLGIDSHVYPVRIFKILSQKQLLSERTEDGRQIWKGSKMPSASQEPPSFQHLLLQVWNYTT